MPELGRRGLLLGLGATLIAAPAIVRAASLMPVRGIVMDVPRIATMPAFLIDRWVTKDLIEREFGMLTGIDRTPVSWWQTT